MSVTIGEVIDNVASQVPGLLLAAIGAGQEIVGGVTSGVVPTIKLATSVQPKSLVTVTLYVPAATPVKSSVLAEKLPGPVHVNDGVPKTPLSVISIAPSLTPAQLTSVAVPAILMVQGITVILKI